MTDKTELARRAVACPAWRWMAGVMGSALHFGERHSFIALGVSVDDESAIIDVFIQGHSHGIYLTEADYEQGGRQVDSGNDALPDLTSPATRGCLLELVREAWGDRFIAMAMGIGGGARIWRCYSGALDDCANGFCEDDQLEEWQPSEAEALVYALEQAPVRPDVAPEQGGA